MMFAFIFGPVLIDNRAGVGIVRGDPSGSCARPDAFFLSLQMPAPWTPARGVIRADEASSMIERSLQTLSLLASRFLLSSTSYNHYCKLLH